MVKMIKTRINGQWDLLLPEHRAVRPEWATGWEAERLDSMYNLITSSYTGGTFADHPPIVLDVGAEEGDMPALFASWGAKVYMIEPNLKVWANIRAIWEANKLKPFGWFVGFASTKNLIALPYNNEAEEVNGYPKCAYGEVVAEHGFNHIAEAGDTISQIKIDSLDFIPDIITIDVEGSEFEVLKGAEQMLRKHHPVLYVSVHPEFMFNNHNQYESELHGFLHDIGYVGTHLAFHHEHHYKFVWHEEFAK